MCRSVASVCVCVGSHWACYTLRMSSGMRSDNGTENSIIETCQIAFSHLVIAILGLIVLSLEAQSGIM